MLHAGKFVPEKGSSAALQRQYVGFVCVAVTLRKGLLAGKSTVCLHCYILYAP